MQVPQFPLTRVSPDPIPFNATNAASRIALAAAVLMHGDSLYVVDGGTPIDDIGAGTPVSPGKISRYERYPPYTYIGNSTLARFTPCLGAPQALRDT